MTTATAAIANHLNIAEAMIVEVQEWAHVLFVRFVGRRPRFVSKKVVEMESAKPAVVKFGQGENVATATLSRYDYLDGVGKVDVYEIRMGSDFHRVNADTFLAGFTPDNIAQLDVYEVI